MNRVLITGAAGFIGHHLLEHILRTTDWEVVCLDRLDTSGTLQRVRDVLSEDITWNKRVTLVWHDLKASINSLVAHKIGQVDYIIHLAAGSHVDRSIEYPMEFVLDNIIGTVNLLDFTRASQPQLKKFLFFSTDEVFGPAPAGIKYKENDRYNSGNPYAATKAGAEELCVAYGNTYKLPILITHTMNVFGIRQHPEKFIPLTIRKVLDQETLFIHANKDLTKAGSRYYINTQDVAEAVLFLLDKGVTGEKYNIVGKEEIDNLSLAKMIADLIGQPLKYELVDFHSSRPGHDLRYALCGEKMKAMGWEPVKSVKERLKEVIEWTLSHQHWINK